MGLRWGSAENGSWEGDCGGSGWWVAVLETQQWSLLPTCFQTLQSTPWNTTPPQAPRLPATSSPPLAKVSQRTVCTALLSGLVITAGVPLHVCVATVWRAGAEGGRGQGEESASGIFLHKELTIFVSRLD